MATTIPVPIEFSLPPGWRSVPPDAVGSPAAAFVALRPPAVDGFTPNITISGELGDDVPLTVLADDALAKLRREVGQVRLGKRTELGSYDSPALTQAVRMGITLHGRPLDVVQLQVFLGMRDVREPGRRVVLHIVLSATPDRFDAVVGEFQRFIATIRPEGPAAGQDRRPR